MKRALAIAIIAATAATAHANGRPPEPTALHFAPNNDTDIYLQVTFGMLESHDGGATWRWVCEEAIGYTGNYDPDYAVSSSGALYATTFDGLKILRDGCQFANTSFGQTMFTQVANDPTGGKIYACASDPTAADHSCYVTSNDGTSWTPIGTGLSGAEVWWSSMEIAPSNPQVIYLTGYTFPTTGTRTDTMYKSVNGGTSWTPIATTAFTTTNTSQIFVSVSPDDPNFVLATVLDPKAGLSNAIWRSTTGGASWTMVDEFDDYVDGVVIRKYGGVAAQASTKAQVVLGTRTSGMWVSNDGGQTFTELTKPPSAGGNAIETRCMAERNGTLWACGNNLPPDSMALGKSATADNWTKVLQFKDIAGTISCAAGTIEEDTCDQQRWCGLRAQLGIVANPTNCQSVAADGPPMDGVPPDGNGTTKPPKGCCNVGGSPAGAALITAVVLVPLMRRRKRAL
jgi:hypothetical protein